MKKAKYKKKTVQVEKKNLMTDIQDEKIMFENWKPQTKPLVAKYLVKVKVGKKRSMILLNGYSYQTRILISVKIRKTVRKIETRHFKPKKCQKMQRKIRKSSIQK